MSLGHLPRRNGILDVSALKSLSIRRLILSLAYSHCIHMHISSTLPPYISRLCYQTRFEVISESMVFIRISVYSI